MPESTVVTLPCGWWDGHQRQRHVVLRAPTSLEILELAESAGRRRAAEIMPSLLAGLVQGVGPEGVRGIDVVRSLVAGDRDALALHVRRLVFGERLESAPRCPASECGQQMDVEIAVGDILLPPYPEYGPWHTVEVGTDKESVSLRFRLPTLGDLEAVAARSTPGATEAASLLRLCLKEDGSPSVFGVGQRSSQTFDAIDQRMAELDPQADIRMSLQCPTCGRTGTQRFDSSNFLLDELLTLARCLLADVHVLASHYHWSEAEILALSPRRRAAYLDLIQGTGSEG